MAGWLGKLLSKGGVGRAVLDSVLPSPVKKALDLADEVGLDSVADGVIRKVVKPRGTGKKK